MELEERLVQIEERALELSLIGSGRDQVPEFRMLCGDAARLCREIEEAAVYMPLKTELTRRASAVVADATCILHSWLHAPPLTSRAAA